MWPQTIKSKLLIGIAALVLFSSVLIAILVTHRFSRSLADALVAQARSLGDAIGHHAVDLVLTNDLVSLQKMLDEQQLSNPLLAYLFVLKDERVLAHTFKGGIPADLVTANDGSLGPGPHMQQIASETGSRFLDIAVPIFEGKAGTLRVGISEEPYRQQVNKLWLQMALLTGLVLLVALTGGLLFVRQVTGPLTRLSQVVDRVDRGEIEARVDLSGKDEVAALAASFNGMLDRLQSYMAKLEEQTLEIERAHNQTLTVCSLVQELGALPTLQEIGNFVVSKLSSIITCRAMVLLLLNSTGNMVFVLSNDGAKIITSPDFIQKVLEVLERENSMAEPRFSSGAILSEILPPDPTQDTPRQAFVPLLPQGQPFGGLLMNCSGNPSCRTDELKLAAVMLHQSAPVIKRAIIHEERIHDLQGRLDASAELYGIVAKDPKMQAIFRLIEDVAPTAATVLIQGESGTGKELIAMAIHQLSPRKDKPFMVINCSAYPSSLLESELFGHEKGAFTGAIRLKQGRFELADGGTVFLDEIGEISPSAQIKLLRVLQTQEFERVGGEKTIAVDVRILAATNKNLLDEVKKGDFREDLYYRLSVIPILLPPLRDRRNDIPLLARHFLRQFASTHGKSVESFSPEAMRALLDHSWPGNVRELENSIEHAVTLAKHAHIEIGDLPAPLRPPQAGSGVETKKPPTMAEHEHELLRRVLEECGWNKKETARRLGVSRNTLYNKIRKYRIKEPFRPA